jgi:hypothetical protein
MAEQAFSAICKLKPKIVCDEELIFGESHV